MLKQEINKNNYHPEKKKVWQKSIILTITAMELQKYVKAAARSTSCGGGYGR